MSEKLQSEFCVHSTPHNYRPQRSWGKVMFLHLSVILFSGGGCLPHLPLGRHPPGQTPPGRHPLLADTHLPWEDTSLPWADTLPPWAENPVGRHPLGRHPYPHLNLNKWAVCILLECNFVCSKVEALAGLSGGPRMEPNEPCVHKFCKTRS